MEAPTMQKIVDIGEAIRHPSRLKIIHLLSQREWYVYELAKELKVSRQVLYLHLKRLEKSGFVEGDLRLEEDDMRAKNFYRLKGFKVEVGLEDLEKIF
ncbi:MAG: winged helix-turn-helix transcriptional regulator [Methanosarcinales archaeon]|nr:winged helix-turn-helix transcriptional regulator [Methanosarcinales archaeon]